MNDPFVTIAIPTYNRPAMLEQCLRTLISQIGPDVEILVSDDASVDETADVLAGFDHERLRKNRNPVNLGLFGNFNECLRLANGQFVIFLSDDDRIDADLVSSCRTLASSASSQGRHLVALIASNRYLTIAADGRRYVSSVESKIASGIYPGHDLLKELWFGNISFQLCGVLFRTSDLRSIGGFAGGHKYAGDVRTFASLFFDRLVAFEAAPKCTYVVHQQSESTALGLNYRLRDLSNVFAEIVTAARKILPQVEASLVARSARHYMMSEYLRNVSDFAEAGGSRRACLVALLPAARWLGYGSQFVPVARKLSFRVFLPLWLKELLWSLERFFARIVSS